MRQAQHCLFWEWTKGSFIFFWRWPENYQDIARNDFALMFELYSPETMEFQSPYSEDEIRTGVRDKVKEKLQIVSNKGYVKITDIKFVEAFLYKFHVPKGDKNICMVYDGTKSKLNEKIYAPWFTMPIINSMTRWVICDSWLADQDYGDIFLNF